MGIFEMMRKQPTRQPVKKQQTPKQTAKQAPRRAFKLPELDGNITRHKFWGSVDVSDDAIAIGRVFKSYGIDFNIVKHTQGPTLTQYTITLPDFKNYEKVTRMEKAFRAALNKDGVTISQNGAYINIQVPCFLDTLWLGDILNDDHYKTSNKLTVAIGRAIDGSNILADIEDLKHILVAGASGSGKSVFMQGLILSLLSRHTPDEIELYMVDPKMVEFSFYRPLKHCHVVTETYDAINLLWNLTGIMDERYRQLAAAGVRDIEGYNAKYPDRKMRRIVLFIDELADLMKTSRKQAEDSIVRIAQKARACGIHLIIATQYPKAEVVTGLIKSNIPTKVCFAVTSPIASCVMLGRGGAEKLIGKGDMLYQTEKDINPVRLQAGFVTENEINNIVYALFQNQN